MFHSTGTGSRSIHFRSPLAPLRLETTAQTRPFQRSKNAPLSARAPETILSQRGGCCRDEPRSLRLFGTNSRQYCNTAEQTSVYSIFCHNTRFRGVLQPQLAFHDSGDTNAVKRHGPAEVTNERIFAWPC